MVKMVKMGCRGYLVGNGFPRVSRHGIRGSQEDHGRNDRKWWKMDFRGYLVGNGFPRFLRHSPTTFYACWLCCNYEVMINS